LLAKIQREENCDTEVEQIANYIKRNLRSGWHTEEESLPPLVEE
jgi:hypothetical protein